MWHKWSIFYLNDTGAADTPTKGAVYQEHHDLLWGVHAGLINRVYSEMRGVTENKCIKTP